MSGSIDGAASSFGASALDGLGGLEGLGAKEQAPVAEPAGCFPQPEATRQGAIASAQFSAGVLEGLLRSAEGRIEPGDTPAPLDLDPSAAPPVATPMCRPPEPGGFNPAWIDNPSRESMRAIERARAQATLAEPLPSSADVERMSPGELYALEQKLQARASARQRLHALSEEEMGGPFLGGVTPESIAEARLLAEVRERLTIG